ncbi:MAG: hypothetical protein JSU03_08405 [Bacteroidetes bacterium]|nr:hypothetical protein [Bacteroidota bacterium]MBS1757285.1 hypothetical protein [Bacteroidota bacterium]
MMINRNNYETYFLLYIDNELSDTEKKAVEDFVALHADLEEEFIQLQETVLPMNKVEFTDKANLFKSQAHDELLQENMLLLLDGELNKEQENNITSIIEKDKNLQADWDILQHTKLDPSESISFPYKNTLYKKERDTVIIGQFVKWAVAAAILVAGFFWGASLLNNKNNTEGIAEIKNTGIPSSAQSNNKITGRDNHQATGDLQAANQNAKNNLIVEPTQSNTTLEKITGKPAQKDRQVQNNSLVDKMPKTNKETLQQTPVVQALHEDKTLMAANDHQKSLPLKNDNEAKNDVAIQNPVIPTKAPATITDVNMAALNNSIAQSAVYPVASAETNNDRILYIKEEKLNRSKAGIFLRKVKRMVERTTNINTDKALRIGGFEVAL